MAIVFQIGVGVCVWEWRVLYSVTAWMKRPLIASVAGILSLPDRRKVELIKNPNHLLILNSNHILPVRDYHFDFIFCPSSHYIHILTYCKCKHLGLEEAFSVVASLPRNQKYFQKPHFPLPWQRSASKSFWCIRDMSLWADMAVLGFVSLSFVLWLELPHFCALGFV